MTPDVKKMRAVYEWCRQSPNYDQSVGFFDGHKRCFGGKVLELYYEGNPFQILGTSHGYAPHDAISKILGITQQEATSKFIRKNLSLSDIDKNIKYYEDQLKPKHNFKVNDYIIVIEKGPFTNRRGRIVNITATDVFVKFNYGRKDAVEFSSQAVVLEDKATSLLRFLYETCVNHTANIKINNLLNELDQQGM